MGRKALYKIDVIRRNDDDTFNVSRALMLKKRKAQIDAFEKYMGWCALNNFLEKSEEAATIFRYCSCLSTPRLHEGAMRFMDPGSVLTTIRNLRNEQRRRKSFEGITHAMVKSHYQALKAKLGSSHAPDADMATLVKALQDAPPDTEGVQLSIMLLTGSRNADIEGFGDIRFSRSESDWTILADVVCSKTRKTPDETTLLTLKGPTCFFNSFSPAQQRRMMSFKTDDFVDTPELLRWMKQHDSTKVFTTYSFRRCYIHNILSAFTSVVNGSINWEAVLQYTLHFSEKTVKSVYAKKAGERIIENDDISSGDD